MRKRRICCRKASDGSGRVYPKRAGYMCSQAGLVLVAAPLRECQLCQRVAASDSLCFYHWERRLAGYGTASDRGYKSRISLVAWSGKKGAKLA